MQSLPLSALTIIQGASHLTLYQWNKKSPNTIFVNIAAFILTINAAVTRPCSVLILPVLTTSIYLPIKNSLKLMEPV
jgi:hypothetical protein